MHCDLYPCHTRESLIEGIPGIGQEVENDLLDLRRRATDSGKIRIELHISLNFVLFKKFSAERQNPAHNLSRSDRNPPYITLPGERQKIPHNLRNPHAFMDDLRTPKMPCFFTSRKPILQQLRVVDHSHQRIVDLVCNAVGQRPDGGEFLFLTKL